MIAADTSFFIALLRKDDASHQRADELMREFSEKSAVLLVTTHVIEETVTYLAARDGPEKAFETALLLLSAKNISIEPVNRAGLFEAAQILRKYRVLSLCDSLSVQLMRGHGLEEIVSFDKGFDRVEKVRRIH